MSKKINFHFIADVEFADGKVVLTEFDPIDKSYGGEILESSEEELTKIFNLLKDKFGMYPLVGDSIAVHLYLFEIIERTFNIEDLTLRYVLKNIWKVKSEAMSNE